jgi:catechol 2,3-dioxygenase
VPSRRDLAFALARLARSGGRLSGASDHLVSEALYLSDPDGNGIEIYRDRPRSEWPRADGGVAMGTLPVDLDGLLAELPNGGAAIVGGESPAPDGSAGWGELAPGTRIGHVHLKVADLASAEDFYRGVLGFEVMQRSYPGALFVAAGGYHHHIGLNTWSSAGADAPPPGAVGLRSFEVRLPDDASLQAVMARIESVGLDVAQRDGGALLHDPSDNVILLRV